MSHAAGHARGHDHRKAYYAVFGALMIGTILTVLVPLVDIGRVGGIALALVIACVKAGLVGYIFMHLKGEERLIFGIALFPILLFLVMVLLLVPDVGLAESTTFVTESPATPH